VVTLIQVLVKPVQVVGAGQVEEQPVVMRLLLYQEREELTIQLRRLGVQQEFLGVRVHPQERLMVRTEPETHTEPLEGEVEIPALPVRDLNLMD
jgi:hypothetical protein